MTQLKSQRVFQVLLVEDDPSDIRIITNSLEKNAHGIVHLTVVRDGQEAISLLRRQGRYEKSATPSLILLDLNLPKHSGREVLSEIKADLNLKHIPVVILTTSSAEQDIRESYFLQASSFITKPGDLTTFRQTLESLIHYWTQTATLPR